MQNCHISGGRTHRKDATSFRFLDIGHAPFSSLEHGKNLKFQRIRIMPVMLGVKRKLVISRIRKNTCSALIYCSDVSPDTLNKDPLSTQAFERPLSSKDNL